jgi:hypothetical protein
MANANSAHSGQSGVEASALIAVRPMPSPRIPRVTRRVANRSAKIPQATRAATLVNCEAAITMPASTSESEKDSTRKLTR